MVSSRWFVFFALSTLLLCCLLSPAAAQQAGVIYTWDHSFGESLGPNNEDWDNDYGPDAPALTNVIDGELTVTETNQTGWTIRDGYNKIREASNSDFGGLDLTGLDSLEIEIGHNGAQTYGGQVYVRTPSAPEGCCNYFNLGPISVAPGAPQVFSVPLTAIPTADELAWVRTLGVQIFDHTWDAGGGPLTWTIKEFRSAGTELTERFLSNHDGAVGLDGAVVKFDSSAVSGGADDSPTGLSVVAADVAGSSSLRWVDLGGGPGAAIAWGNGRDGINAVNYHTRPTDLRNYDFVEVRMRAQGGAGADPNVDVQFYFQTTDGYNYQSAGDLSLPVDSAYHVLTFPLAGISNLGDVQWHGINVNGHAGNMDLRVDYVRFRIPEPSTVALLAIGCLGALGLVRRRS